MTEEQIERAVERKFNNLDARFIPAHGTSSMTQEEYEAEAAAIHAWAENEYRFVDVTGFSILLATLKPELAGR